MTTINRKLNNKIRQTHSDFSRLIWRYDQNPNDENRIAAILAQNACYQAIQNLAEDKPFNYRFWAHSIDVQASYDKQLHRALKRHDNKS